MAASKRIPRWLKITISSLIVLVGIAFMGGGVVFANMIHSDALNPQPPTPDNGVFVTAIGTDTVTLTSKEERADTVRPGVAGLVWEDGYGQIADIIEVDGLEVTRLFMRSAGVVPPVCEGPLSRCDEVDIESWAYQSDPADVRLDFDDVVFPGPLGELSAWRIDSGEGTVWAIHAHGWRASRREALRSLGAYHQSGITSLVIDYRNDEGAPSDPTNLYRFGRSEWEDVEAAVRYAQNQGAERVVLVGYSTGAALHLAFLENSELGNPVVAAVFDSPNVDMGETVRYEASKRSIPGTSLPVPGPLTAVAMAIAELRWDVGWKEIDYVDRVDEIVTIPILVFHGTEDERVPLEVSRRFQEKAPDLVTLVEVPKAGHVTSWNVHPEAYEARLSEFLESITRN
jgi:hypothetical protein